MALLKSKISELKTKAKSDIQKGSDKLTSVKDSAVSLKKDLIHKGDVGSIGDLSKLKTSVGGAVSNLTDSIDSIAQLKDVIPDAKNIGSKVLDKLKSSSSALSSIGVTGLPFLTSKKNGLDENSKVASALKISDEEAKAYDSNGLKHFMNIFLDTLKSEKISFKQLGGRRWGVGRENNQVYGNAFLQRQNTTTYKTLDSDGNYYWLSDYQSRHYYGEAVDISSSNLSELLEKIALSTPVIEVMHKFGICIQYEDSESGVSKGTHFHCSTDEGSSQSKWWGIVNQLRVAQKLKTYSILVTSDYFEKETQNAVEIA